MEVNSFWNYGVDEIIDIIESHRRVEKAKIKQEISNNYMQAFMIRDGVASLFDEKVKPKQLHEIYPDLFVEEKEVAGELQRQNELEMNKERLRAFAERFNKNLKKGE
ncbi:hypothetical protein [Granulicatella adiacens]